MNIITCTDIHNKFILKCFIEVLINTTKKSKKNTKACLIIGDKYCEKIPLVLNIIKKHTEIGDENIIVYSGINSLPGEVVEKIIKNSTYLTKKTETIEDLKNLIYEDFEIGIPVSSNIISKYFCSTPDIKEIKKEVENYIKYSLFTYYAFKEVIIKNPNSSNYIYNGRSYNTYPISKLSSKEKNYYYERIDNWKRLRIQKGRIHDFIYNSEQARLHWQESKHTNSEKEAIGHLFFKENKNNQFSENFNDKKLFFSKKTITFFSSSDDEFASLHPEIEVSHLFNNQRDCINFLVDWAAKQDEYQLVIRVHPHQEKKCAQDRKFWNSLNGKNITLIPSNSEINSYLLMEASDKIVTFLSSTGIEAAYYGKPSIILANTIYMGNDAVYEPKSLKEILDILESPLVPKDQKNCLIYGYYIKTYGHDFELSDDVFDI